MQSWAIPVWRLMSDVVATLCDLCASVVQSSGASAADDLSVPRGSHQGAFISATVTSSMRLEKPHSLSYQLTTFTRRPSITLVRGDS